MSLASIKTKQIACLNDIYDALEEQGVDTSSQPKNLVNVAPAIKSIEGGGSGPTFIDYIESTGTQYIDTGYIPTNSTKIELDIQHLSDDSLNGCGDFYYTKILQFGRSLSRGIYIRHNNEYITFPDVDVTSRHFMTIDIPNLVASIGTNTQNISYKEGFNVGYSMLLFARFSINGDAGIVDYFGKQKLYSCKIYDSDVLVRNFKPCIDPNGVYCLYDSVEGKYYYNQGTGSFTGEGVPTQVVNYKMLYDGSLGEAGASGANVCAEVTGGYDLNTPNQSNYAIGISELNVDHMRCYSLKSETAELASIRSTIWSLNQIDINNYAKIASVAKCNWNNLSKVWFGANLYENKSVEAVSNSAARGEWYSIFNQSSDELEKNIKKIYSFDLTQTTSKNFYFYITTMTSTLAEPSEINIYETFMVKQDLYQSILNLAGIPTTYADENALCADGTAMAIILNNKKAVEYMIYNCTGTFMLAFINSSTALTALNNSTYKTMIQANEHWNKFLNMVA